MEYREVGRTGLKVSEIGMGCEGFVGKSQAQIREMVDLMEGAGVNCIDLYTPYPQELSGGELQRFCIARALGPGTRYLLCDEITAMLDLITQAQIWDFLLREAERRNLGLLVVSHSAPLLERVCSRRVELPPLR